MDYRRVGDKIVARIDRGEELTAKLREIAEREDIGFAAVTGHGQCNKVELYAYHERKRGLFGRGDGGAAMKVTRDLFQLDDFVMSSITGCVIGPDTVDIDAVMATPVGLNRDEWDTRRLHPGMTWAGHVKSAIVSTTCTLIIELIDLDAHMTRSDSLGCDVLEFDS